MCERPDPPVKQLNHLFCRRKSNLCCYGGLTNTKLADWKLASWWLSSAVSRATIREWVQRGARGNSCCQVRQWTAHLDTVRTAINNIDINSNDNDDACRSFKQELVASQL